MLNNGQRLLTIWSI